MPFLSDTAFAGSFASIPPHMQAALRRYVEEGVKPGSFLTAVICNDLCEAINRADDVNLLLLKVYVQWFYNEAPGNCWHNKENMREWMNARSQDEFSTPERARV